jgi:hypothetical protein
MENKNWEKLEFTFKFTGEQSQLLLNTLAMLPYNQSINLIQMIQEQTVPQFMKYEQAANKAKEEQ